MTIHWDVEVGRRASLMRAGPGWDVPIIKSVKVVYRKLRNGAWLDDPSKSDAWPAPKGHPYAPDLNRVLDPKRSDADIMRYLGLTIESGLA